MKNSPKVGDTINAKIAPETATDPKFAWFVGDSATQVETPILDATTASFTVTEAYVGKFIKVTVTGADGSAFSATTTAAVAGADAPDLRILTATQTGAKTVDVTFSSAVTSDDVLSVKKGTSTVTIDSTQYTGDFKGATLTLADKITATEYNVTLTPKNDKISPSTATFTGEVSTLKDIVFMSDKFVLKDNTYSEGYAYVKGVDQFESPVNLSGLSVTSGVGTFKSYDSETGKITIKDDNYTTGSTGAFMLIKQVPVFVQYQEGNTMISKNATLDVSSQAYLTTMDFGEIKKDGTPREDGRLTVDELGSNKYYVEILNPKDQYENPLNADDLNNQKKEKVLFVIPDDSGAFYETAGFGTVDNTTVLWLASPGDPKPGPMALTITGAGGATFSKDVEILDNPYINTLTVGYPELYAGAASATFEFSAVDQYDNEVDLWDFRPHLVYDDSGNPTNILEFGDVNGMTGRHTQITASNAEWLDVITDAAKKTFNVRVRCTAADAGKMAVFTLTTAGMQVSPKSITIGSHGIPAKVKSTLAKGAPTQLSPVSDGVAWENTLNFNKFVQFEDVNGNTMSRGAAVYPIFRTGSTAITAVAKDAEYKGGFYWTLSEEKLTEGKTYSSELDGDGSINSGDFATKQDYYVTLLGEDTKNSQLNILDSKTFHVTEVTGSPRSYTATLTKSLFVDKDSVDSVSVEVTVKTDSGESYRLEPSNISVTCGSFETKDDTIYGKNDKIEADGTEKASVYVGSNEVGSVDVKYTVAKPAATTTKFKYYTNETTISNPSITQTGADYDGDSGDELSPVDANGATAFSIDKDGVLQIADANPLGDTIKAWIEDQYECKMADTKFYLDGKIIEDNTAVTDGRHAIEMKNGSVSKKFYVTTDNGPYYFTVEEVASYNVTTEAELRTALQAAAQSTASETIQIIDNLETTGAASLVVPFGDTLLVAKEKTFKNSGSKVENNGTIEVVGTWDEATASDLNATGEVIVRTTGVWKTKATTSNGTVTNNGNITLGDNFKNGYKFINKGTVDGASTYDFENDGIYEGTGDTLSVVDLTCTSGSFETNSDQTLEGVLTLTEGTAEFGGDLLVDDLAMTFSKTTDGFTVTGDLTVDNISNDLEFTKGTNQIAGNVTIDGAYDIVFTDGVNTILGTITVASGQGVEFTDGENTVVEIGENFTTTITDGTNAIGKISSSGAIAIDGGTNTIEELDATGTFTTGTGGKTTIGTLTDCGTFTIGSSTEVDITGSIKSGFTFITSGTLDVSAITGAVTATLTSQANNTLKVADAADLTANQTFTVTHSGTGSITVTPASGTCTGSPVDSSAGNANDGNITGNAATHAWTAAAPTN